MTLKESLDIHSFKFPRTLFLENLQLCKLSAELRAPQADAAAPGIDKPATTAAARSLSTPVFTAIACLSVWIFDNNYELPLNSPIWGDLFGFNFPS